MSELEQLVVEVLHGKDGSPFKAKIMWDPETGRC
jgi:hypothetical protein